MRAPDDKKPLRLPGFSGVPKYSAIERACREAGAVPKRNKIARASADRRIARLFHRAFHRDGVTPADLHAVAAYYSGEFDRRQKQGRPRYNVWLRHGIDAQGKIVRQFQRDEKCSLRRAIDLARPLLGLDDAAAARLWKRMTR
jgi:hypothetical protein